MFMRTKMRTSEIAPRAITELQLDYSLPTDVTPAISAGTWTTVGANNTFTVDDANSLIEFAVRGMIGVSHATLQNSIASRLLIDGARARRLGGIGQVPPNNAMNALAGASSVFVAGLAAGAHTVQVQVYSHFAATVYCRPVSWPDLEGLDEQVVEHKR